MPPLPVHGARQWIPRTRRISEAETRYCGADRKLTTLLTRLTRNISLGGPRNAAVLPDAPEVHGHQKGCDERDSDAVQHVEAQERARAHEAAAEQAEPRVVRRRDERDVADLEQ